MFENPDVTRAVIAVGFAVAVIGLLVVIGTC